MAGLLSKERGIDLKRKGFDVRNTILSSFREVSDLSKEERKDKL